MPLTCFIVLSSLTNWTFLGVCCGDPGVPLERVCPYFYWFTVLTITPCLSQSDHFLILVFWRSTRSQVVFFSVFCPVLKLGSLLFLSLPSVNFKKFLGYCQLPIEYQILPKYIQMLSLLNFNFEWQKSCHLYFSRLSSVTQLVLHSLNPWILWCWLSQKDQSVGWRRALLLSDSQTGSQLRKGDKRPPWMVSSCEAVSVIHPLPPGPAVVPAPSRFAGSPSIHTYWLWWHSILLGTEPYGVSQNFWTVFSRFPVSMWKMALLKLNYLFHDTQVALLANWE